MKNNWKTIWNRRESCTAPDLSKLIALDGFDAGAGRIDAHDWRKYVATIAQKIGLRDGHSVYEVGCGSGAFLYAMRDIYQLHVGGLDYSANQVISARNAMPDGEFSECAAHELDTEQKFDFVISNSVFEYFQLDYAEKVLKNMILKSNLGIAVLDVPDLATRDKSEAVRASLLPPDEYEKKYAGLEHTYYARDWFREQARQHGMTCDVFDGCVPNYSQNCFRFGCVMFSNNER